MVQSRRKQPVTHVVEGESLSSPTKRSQASGQPPVPEKPPTLKSKSKDKESSTDSGLVTLAQRHGQDALEGKTKLITLATLNGQHSMQLELVWRNKVDRKAAFDNEACYKHLKYWSKIMVMKSGLSLHALITLHVSSDNFQHVLTPGSILQRILNEDIDTVYAVLVPSTSAKPWKLVPTLLESGIKHGAGLV